MRRFSGFLMLVLFSIMMVGCANKAANPEGTDVSPAAKTPTPYKKNAAASAGTMIAPISRYY